MTRKNSLLVALLLLASWALAQNSEELKLNEEKMYVMSPNASSASRLAVRYFNLTLAKKYEGIDLSITVRPADFESNPDIYISETQRFPSSYEDSSYFCASFGMDICIIGHENITDQAKFFVGVTCLGTCSFYIKASYLETMDFRLDFNAARNSYFLENILSISKDAAAMIVKITVPEENDLERFEFDFNIENRDMFETPLNVYMNHGDRVPSTQVYDVKGLVNWNNGQTVLITKTGENKNRFKLGSKYTFLVNAPLGSLVRLRAEASKKIKIISLYSQIDEVVATKEINTYELTISDEWLERVKTNTLWFMLTSYSGNPDLYVNPEFLPESLSDYKWNSTAEDAEDLSISADDRKLYTNTKFFISVYGQSASAFSLFAASTRRGGSGKHLFMGFTETGTVLTNEIINYRLRLFGDKSFNITFNLKALSGNPDLYLKSCNSVDRRNCALTLEEVKNRFNKDSTSNEIFFFSDNQGSKDSVTFFHDTSKCSSELPFWNRFGGTGGREGGSGMGGAPFPGRNPEEGPNNGAMRWGDGPDSPWRWPFFNRLRESSHFGEGWTNCMYIVAVVGNSEIESRYQLSADYEKEIQLLKEKTSTRVNVEEGKFKYFKLYLTKSDEVEYVSFQATPISGVIKLFGSMKERFPNSTLTATEVSQALDMISFTKANYPNLYDYIYVGVKGETAATCNLNVIVVRKNSETQTALLYPELGVQLKVSFRGNKTLHYLKYAVEAKSDQHPKMHINLLPIQGRFALYLKRDAYPTLMDYDYMTVEENMEVELKSPPGGNQVVSNTFIALVVPFTNVPNYVISNEQEYEFFFQYSLIRGLKTIRFNIPHYDFIESAGESQYFQFEIPAQGFDEGVDIIPTAFGDGSMTSMSYKIYISNDSRNTHPNKHKYSSILDENSKFLHISKEDITKSCPTIYSKVFYTPCFYYMAFTSEISQKFSLLVKLTRSEEEHAIFLKDGVPQHIPLPDNSSPIYMYYICTENSRDPITVSAHSQYGIFGLYAKFVKKVDFRNQTEDFPTESVNEYMSVSFSTFSSFVIKENEISNKDCWKQSGGCVLLLTILKVLKAAPIMSNTTAFETSKSVTVVVTTQLAYLTLGEPMYTFVEKESIKYFSFYNDKSDCSILISASTSFGTDPTLFVSFGKGERPTANQNGWSSYGNFGSQIKITKKDFMAFFKGNALGGDMKGTYVLGVYSEQDSKIGITVTVGDYKMVDLFQGLDQEGILKDKENIYYNFYHNMKGNLRLLFTVEMGMVYFAINTLQKKEVLAAKLPSIQERRNYIWSNRNTPWVKSLVIKETDPSYCTDCRYLIQVQSMGYSKFSIFVASSETTIYLSSGKTFFDIIDQNQENLYLISRYINSQNTLTIDMKIFKGNVVAFVGHQTVSKTTYKEIQYMDKENCIHFDVNLNTTNPSLPAARPSGFFPGIFPYMGPIHLLVVGNADSNYSITIGREDQNLKLQYGVPNNVYLKSLSSRNFTFYSVEAGDKLMISLNIQSASFEAKMFVEFLAGKGEVEKEKNKVYPYSDFTQLNLLNGTGILFTANKGLYTIQITNRESKDIRFVVMLNHKNLNLMSPNSTTVDFLLEGQTLYYELFPRNRKDQLIIEVDECTTRTEIMVSKNYEHLRNGVYDIDLRYPLANRLVGWMNITDENMPIYLAVKNKDKEGFYALRAVFLSPNEINPYDNFFLRDAGRLKWSIEGNKLSLKAGSLSCLSNCDGLSFTVAYDISFDKNVEELDKRLKCFDVQPFDNKKKIQTDQKDKLIAFEFDLHEMKKSRNIPDDDAFFNVRAKLYLHGGEFVFYYNPVQVYLNAAPAKSASTWIIWVLLLSLAVVGGLAFFIYKRYKNVEKRLNYEMNDVRNVANLSKDLETTNSTNEKNKYMGLVLTESNV